MTKKRTVTKVVIKIPANMTVKKTVPAKKTAGASKMVRTLEPAVKTEDKGAAVDKVPKSKVHILKKVQTAEGWKRQSAKKR